MQPLVRAAVSTALGLGATFRPGATGTFQPGMLPMPGLVPGPSAASQAAARSTELLRTGVWLVVSVAGTAFGIALSASLTSMLR